MKDFWKNSLLSGGWPYLWIILTGFALYARTLFYGITYLDDSSWLLDYQYFLKNLSNIRLLFSQPDFLTNIFYRPVLGLSFMLDAQGSGSAPFGYHLTNVGIHLINACLVFALLMKLGYRRGAGFFFALVFTVHPGLTMAVAWIPGRTDSLLGLFVLASFIFFLKYLERKNWLSLVFHLLFLLLAFLTKETGFVLPVICFIYLCLIDTREGRKKKDYGLGFGWAVVLGGCLILRKMILKGQFSDGGVVWAMKSIHQDVSGFVFYLGKAILPLTLSVVPVRPDVKLTLGIVSLMILVLTLLVGKKKRMKHVLFGLIWFFLFLLPGVIHYFVIHEYRVYLPLIGCLIVFMEVVHAELPDIRPSLHRKILFLSTGFIILLFSITLSHSRHLKNGVAFWRNAVKTSPSYPLSHRNLGAMYYFENRLDEAEAAYKKSLELNPYEPMVHNNLGVIYMNRNKDQKAEKEYKTEIALNPGFDKAYANLALIYYRHGKMPEAALLWRKTLDLNPNNFEVYISLAVCSMEQGQRDRAVYYVEQMQKRGGVVPVEILRRLNL